MSLPKSKQNSKIETSKDIVFECTYCHKHYVRENAYLRHECPIKLKQEQGKSPLGQAAYLFYAKWMKSSRRAIPDNATFLSSKFYEPFIRFAKFNKSVRLPSIDLYVDVMNRKKITPELWTDDRAYAIYLEHMEFHADPLLSVKITSSSLDSLADEYECKVEDVFQVANKNEIIQLIRERKLSPWILLKSKKFFAFLDTLSEEQTNIVETLIDSVFWKKKFKEDPKNANYMNNCVQALGL